jgi:hypothetical protein
MKRVNLKKMKIILYAEDRQGMGENLEKGIQHQLPNLQTDVIDSVRRLSSALCRPLNRVSVIVIFVMCEQDIGQFLALKPLFDNIRLILVLPDRTTGMMGPWLQLKPCFISYTDNYTDNDFSDIISVLKKIDTGQKRQLQ